MAKKNKEIIAMLLAGGQGSRLYVLTKNTAKPAVPFGGKYRIIDFTLSNCIHSGIDTVGVLTQYRPLELNSYIGIGEPWDLNITNGGVHILPPYSDSSSGEWYKGTANAVYQNMEFVEQYNPEFLLVLSGDHIYKMDYSQMLAQHKKTGAACTVATIKVPLKDAPRFGIINTDGEGRIYEFEEKPEKPKCDNASMGIYIFTWSILKKYLTDDDNNPESKNDFGADILPSMVASGEKIMAYSFNGYWKDVGTIDSLWDANMDLLTPGLPLELRDPDWTIYSRSSALAPQYIGCDAQITKSMVTENCSVEGKLWNSILFTGVTVGKGASLDSSVVMSNTVIGKNADIRYAIIAQDAVIGEGAVIGQSPDEYDGKNDWGIAVIGRGAVVKAGQIVRPNEMIEPYSGR